MNYKCIRQAELRALFSNKKAQVYADYKEFRKNLIL
jgi:hypothetical protein